MLSFSFHLCIEGPEFMEKSVNLLTEYRGGGGGVAGGHRSISYDIPGSNGIFCCDQHISQYGSQKNIESEPAWKIISYHYILILH